MPIQSIIEQLYKAIGKPNILIQLFFVEKSIGIIIILITMPFGVRNIALGMLATSIICTIVHLIPLKKEINFKYTNLISCLKEPVIFCLIMVIPALAIKYFNFNSIMSLLLEVVLGGVTYLIVSILFKSKNLLFLLKVLYNKFNNNILLNVIKFIEHK